MCARYALLTPLPELLALFAVDPTAFKGESEDPPRYNVAPSQPVPVICQAPSGRVLGPMRWGFLPAWAKEANKAMVNARAETAWDKPMFKGALATRRAILPATGFYEWKTEGGVKVPYVFTRRDGQPLAFAGLWERWTGPDGPVTTTALLTTTPNATLAPIHDRMPVILPDPAAWDAWLDRRTPADQLQALCAPAADDLLESRPVNRKLGNPRVEGPELWMA